MNPDTISSIKAGDIAFISCDASAYTGNLGASSTFSFASLNDPAPAAIILYSEVSTYCNYTASGSDGYSTILTTVDPMVAFIVASRNNSASASIYPDEAAVESNSSGGSNSTTNGLSSFSAIQSLQLTTMSAMIILYAITGLITALFLIIIITGAVRAHRHPERYGPRNIIGRARQSRARGIARAMLETIPVIKFGDPDPHPVKHTDDMEMATTHVEGEEEQTTFPTAPADATEETSEQKERSQGNDSTTHLETSNPDGPDENGTLGCSICTEDFSKGQEVRVLPCNHKFHPDCIDPWLLNVSGTCPLW